MRLPPDLEVALRGLPGVTYVGLGPDGIEILIDTRTATSEIPDECLRIIRHRLGRAAESVSATRLRMPLERHARCTPSGTRRLAVRIGLPNRDEEPSLRLRPAIPRDGGGS